MVGSLLVVAAAGVGLAAAADCLVGDGVTDPRACNVFRTFQQSVRSAVISPGHLILLKDKVHCDHMSSYFTILAAASTQGGNNVQQKEHIAPGFKSKGIRTANAEVHAPDVAAQQHSRHYIHGIPAHQKQKG